MKCQFCNSEVEEGQKLCPVCGSIVEAAPAEVQGSNDQFGSQQFNDEQQYGSSQYNNEQYNYGQYNGGQYMGSQPEKPINGTPYLVFSILVTLMCCLPLGIAAIVYAGRIDSAQKAGDYQKAQDAAKKAKLFTIISAVLGAIIIAIYIGFVAVGGLGAYSIFSELSSLEETSEYDDDYEEYDPYDDYEDDQEPVKEMVPAVQSSELGENWDSYTVQINDKVLTLPCTVADLETAGVTLDVEDTPEDYIVNSEEYMYVYFEDVNGNELMVELFNFGEGSKTVKECLVGGISVDDYSLEEGGMTVIFPGGVQIGMTEEEVVAKYGEAGDVYEGEGLLAYTWSDEMSYYKSCEIDFDSETGKVVTMDMVSYE